MWWRRLDEPIEIRWVVRIILEDGEEASKEHKEDRILPIVEAIAAKQHPDPKARETSKLSQAPHRLLLTPLTLAVVREHSFPRKIDWVDDFDECWLRGDEEQDNIRVDLWFQCQE